jgi:hypothetical protein
MEVFSSPASNCWTSAGRLEVDLHRRTFESPSTFGSVKMFFSSLATRCCRLVIASSIAISIGTTYEGSFCTLALFFSARIVSEISLIAVSYRIVPSRRIIHCRV